MSEIALLRRFERISIREARVDSKLPAGVTLCFCLSPTPIPAQWKTMFYQISNDKHGSVISKSDPLLHGDNVIWQVVEGDIPNAKRFVEERVEQANVIFEQMLVDVAQLDVLRSLESTTQSELDRLQAVLDGSA